MNRITDIVFNLARLCIELKLDTSMKTSQFIKVLTRTLGDCKEEAVASLRHSGVKDCDAELSTHCFGLTLVVIDSTVSCQ